VDNYFKKIDRFKVLNGVTVQKKGCLWAMKPEKINKINAEFQKYFKKDPQRKEIKKGMANPDIIPALERGEMKKDYSITANDTDSENEIEEDTPTRVVKVVARQENPHHTPIEGANPKLSDILGFNFRPKPK
jgi:hypothetical protein